MFPTIRHGDDMVEPIQYMIDRFDAKKHTLCRRRTDVHEGIVRNMLIYVDQYSIMHVVCWDNKGHVVAGSSNYIALEPYGQMAKMMLDMLDRERMFSDLLEVR